MSEQERPPGRPQKPQDYSLPSIGQSTDEDGRPVTSSGRQKRPSRSFDPTQYVQGQPSQSQSDDRFNNRYAAQAEHEVEELPLPSYQPQKAETIAPTPPLQEPLNSEVSDRIYARVATEVADSEGQHTAYPPANSTSKPETHDEPPRRSMAKTMNVLGAGTSIALLLGLGFWGYKLAVRDVTGVPVVAALDGPMRIQPIDPGGKLATHQGLAVNAVQAEGEAEPAADRLILAPKTVDVREGDGVLTVPLLSTPKKPNDVVSGSEAVANVPSNLAKKRVVRRVDIVASSPEIIPKKLKRVEVSEEIKAPEALDVIAAAKEAELEAAAAKTVDIEEPAKTRDAIEMIDASVPGVNKSERPAGRPDGFAKLVALQKSTASGEAEATEVADAVLDTTAEIMPETLTIGTNLAQLGAYPSPEQARAEWNKKAAKFEDFMSDKSRVIQRAESGGRAFYRLRAHGFETINEARQFCAALQAEGAECISVVVRK